MVIFTIGAQFRAFRHLQLYYICHAKVILFCLNFLNKYIISILGELENLIEELGAQFPRSKEYRQKWEKRRTNLLERWDEARPYLPHYLLEGYVPTNASCYNCGKDSYIRYISNI